MFIGEQGLDITGTGVTAGSTVSWYDFAATPGVSSPNAVVPIDDPENFSVSPALFVGRAGNWYLGTCRTVAYQEKDPALNLKIWDQNAQKDVSGQVVPVGTILNFRIESNMYTMSLRSDFANPPPDMRITVRTADGTVYTSLYNTPTNSTSLLNLMVNIPSFYWVTVNNPALGWATGTLDSQGNRIYEAGTYTIRAESNTNGMKDNYKDLSGVDNTGKTVSQITTITISTLRTFPGMANFPSNPDGDGLYEDINGNGRKDFGDVIDFFRDITWIPVHEPIQFFDFNGNGRLDFNDVIRLFLEIGT